MKKKPKTSKVDYEDLAHTYQVVEVALLNSILKAHGITDKRKRRKICDDFIFDQGLIFDEGGFQTEPGGKWYAPVPCFADAQGNPDDGWFGRTKKFYRLSEDSPSSHEAALSNCAYFFEDLKEKTDFDWGPEHE
jgi:hypothetical protein